MLSVTVNYKTLDKDQYLAAAQRLAAQSQRRSPRLAMMLVVLAPLLIWYGWHQQWLALAVIAVWSWWFWRKKSRPDLKNLERQLDDHAQVSFTLHPAGILSTWYDDGYRLSAWSNHEPPVIDEDGLSFKFAWGDGHLFLPRVAFSSTAELDDFAAQARNYHAAAAAQKSGALPVVREPESNARYRLQYQPRDELLVVTQVFPELQKQYPHLVPPDPPVSGWKTWLIIALGSGTLYAMFFDLHRNEIRSFDYTRSVSLGFLLYLVYLWLLLKVYVRLQPRWAQASMPQVSEVSLALTDHGVHVRQPDAECFTPWSDYNAVVHHAGYLTLWRGWLCLNIIPETAFASPEDAAACAAWVLPKLAPPQDLHAEEQQPDSPPIYPPASDNPYQAPRYS